jgi:hypothetical protein
MRMVVVMVMMVEVGIVEAKLQSATMVLSGM